MRRLLLLAPLVAACMPFDQGGYHMKPPGTLTYKDVRPILAARCVGCHVDGGAGPFALVSYLQAKRQSDQIAADTANGYMPPCGASSVQGSFCPSGSLTGGELMILKQWINEGCKRGSDTIPIRPVKTPSWPSGVPDERLTFDMPPMRSTSVVWVAVAIPPVPTRSFRGFDVIPNNRECLRQVTLYAVSQGYRAPKELKVEPTGGRLLGCWSMGGRAPQLPKGNGFVLRARERMVAVARYHPTGADEDGGFRLGLYKAGSGANEAAVVSLTSEGAQIPANQVAFEVKAEVVLERSIAVTSVTPRMRSLGRSASLMAILPNGKRVVVFQTPRWNPAWVLACNFRTPLVLEAGSKLQASFTFDNTAENVRNPNRPPHAVKIGSGSSDERAEFDLIWVSPQSLAVSARG